MIVETLVISLIIGKIKGGKIDKIGYLNIRKWYIFIAAFAIKILALLIASKTDGSLSKIINANFPYIHIFIYFLFLLGLFFNLEEGGFKFIFAGSLLNFLPIAFNKGKMPISIGALKFSKLYDQLSLLDQDRIMTHGLIEEGTRFSILSDIIPIPKPYFFPKIISIGDILLGLGLYILIIKYMTWHENEYIENRINSE